MWPIVPAHRLLVAFFAFAALPTITSALTVTVPGTANPWLAGAASGTTASGGDAAPAQSPVVIDVSSAAVLRFFVSGRVGHQAGNESGPEGVGYGDVWDSFHNTYVSHGAENGIGEISGIGLNALVGVFLDNSTPVAGTEPPVISGGGYRNEYSVAPALREPFFIGNGCSGAGGSGGERQMFVVPSGATRLFLGTMDGTSWNNNTGSFIVNYTIDSGAVNTLVRVNSTDITGAASDVNTEGTLEYAVNFTRTDGGNADVTINSVPFVTFKDGGLNGVGNNQFDIVGGVPGDYNYGSSSAPYSALSADMKTLVGTGMMRDRQLLSGSVHFEMTLNSLTSGTTYLLQLWFNDSGDGPNPTGSGFNGIGVWNGSWLAGGSAFPNTTYTAGGLGQIVNLVFTANAPGITLRIGSTTYPVLNAFQLRSGTFASPPPQITDTELPIPGNSFTVTGGTAPYTFIVESGILPSGLSLSSAGLVSGAPAGTSDGSVTIRVTDANSQFSSKTFDFHFDLGRPEIALRRVVITAGAGTQRLATFEVVAGDDRALSPLESDVDYTNASHCFEYRYKTGTGSFGAWSPAVYFPGVAQPSVWYDNTSTLRFEMRSIDAKGNRSRVIAYDIAKNVAASPQNTFGTTLAAPVTLLSGAGSSIVKLFAEDLNNTSLSTEVAALDRDTGKLSVIYNTNRSTPSSSAKTSITIPGTPVLDAAVGRLLPLGTTGPNDQMQDFVVCTANGLRVITNKTGASPVLALHPTTALTSAGITFKRVTVGDVDGDGDDDIIAVGENAGAWSMAVFKNLSGTSTSGFGAATLTALDIDAVRCITAGDINGDGVADVVIGANSNSVVAGEDSVFCFMSNYNTGLNSYWVETRLGHEIVDVKIADYSGHRLGQKDVIVGTIEGPDATYPFATHMAKHRVLVHRETGLFTEAPARKLAAITLTDTEEANDKAVFNLAVAPYSTLNGSPSNRVTPDIIGCQYSSTSGGATLDDGFLPPQNAVPELHWMNGDANGVVNIGTSTGKARRVALGDLMGSSQLDVILADADSGNIVVMRNDKALLNPMPPGVTLSKTLPVPSQTILAPGGRTNGATSGIAFQTWQFKYTIASAPADTVAKVEYQLNNGPWTTLPGGTLTKSGTTFSANVSGLPEGWLRFRCWATSAAQTALGVYDSYSAPSSYIRSIASQDLIVSVRAMPDSSPNDNVSTHNSEYIRYELSYENTGSDSAQNVVLAAGIPSFTTFGGVPSVSGSGASAGAIFDNMDSLKTKVVSWNLATVLAGETGMRYFLVQVNSDALTKATARNVVAPNGKTISVRAIDLKAVPAATLASPPTTEASFLTLCSAQKFYGIYSSAPAIGFKPQLATGSAAMTPVVPPLTLTQVITGGSVTPGSVVDVELIVRNHGTVAINNVVVEDFVEESFFVEGARLRNPPSATTGNFDDLLDTSIDATGNPQLVQKTGQGRFLRWNVGTLAGTGFPPTTPPGECRMRYKLRVRWDVSPQQMLADGNLIAKQLSLDSLSATGTPQGATAATSANVDIMPRLLSDVTPVVGLNPPQISFTQDVVPLVGNDGSTATEPAVRQTMLVGAEEMASVAQGGLVRVKLRYENTGGTDALRTRLLYTLPKQTEFIGFVKRDSVAVTDPNVMTLIDAAGGTIPSSAWATRIKEARRVYFNLGTLAANSSGLIDFIIAAWHPPLASSGTNDSVAYTAVVKAANEKPAAEGQTLRSTQATMVSDSLITAATCSPSQVPIFVARPVAFDVETKPDLGQIVQNAGSPVDVRFLIAFNNTGWSAASNVEVIANIPDGTTLISSTKRNPSDLADLFEAGQGLTATNAATTYNLAKRVKFTYASIPSGYLDNPAARGLAEVVVRVPWPRPANFPKDGRLKMRTEVFGKDSVSGKNSMGTAQFRSLLAVDKMPVQKGISKPLLANASETACRIMDVNAGLYVMKQVPSIVRPNQRFAVDMIVGNCGSSDVTNVVLKVQVPWGTVFDANGTTTGFTKLSDTDTVSGQKTPNVYQWNLGTIQPGSTTPMPKLVRMMVRVNNTSAYEGNYLYENSCVVTGTAGTLTIQRVPGNVRMLVLSQNPAASAWQWWGAQMKSLGATIFGERDANLKNSLGSISYETALTTIQGADTFKTSNGVTLIQLGGGNVVASGGGNVVAAGGGNIVASGGGNIVAAGAGNLINVTGVGALTATNISNIVAAGGGNIVAGGAGNMIVYDALTQTNRLLANDGGGFTNISASIAGIVAAGGGNVVAAGGGNVVAAGGGNIVAGGAGNYTPGLNSVSAGAVIDPRGGSILVTNALLANDGGSLLANDGGGLLANDGGGLLANDGGGLLANDGGGLLANDGGGLLANDGGGIIGLNTGALITK